MEKNRPPTSSTDVLKTRIPTSPLLLTSGTILKSSRMLLAATRFAACARRFLSYLRVRGGDIHFQLRQTVRSWASRPTRTGRLQDGALRAAYRSF